MLQNNVHFKKQLKTTQAFHLLLELETTRNYRAMCRERERERCKNAYRIMCVIPLNENCVYVL